MFALAPRSLFDTLLLKSQANLPDDNDSRQGVSAPTFNLSDGEVLPERSEHMSDAASSPPRISSPVSHLTVMVEMKLQPPRLDVLPPGLEPHLPDGPGGGGWGGGWGGRCHRLANAKRRVFFFFYPTTFRS